MSLGLENFPVPEPPPAYPVALQRSIVWEDDGSGNLMPKPVSVPLIESKAANALVSVAASLPYTGRYTTKKVVEKSKFGESETYEIEEFQPVEIYEPEFVGMSQLEVTMIRLSRAASSGSLSALEQLLDRLLGKPITKGMSLSADLPYEKYLELIAQKEGLA